MSLSMILGRVVLPAIGLILVAALTWRSLRDTNFPDGRAPANVAVAARGPGRVRAEGRVVAHPGAYVTVSSEVLGTITNLGVSEKSRVEKGDLIAELHADDVLASLREARHLLSEAEVGLRVERARYQASWFLSAATTGKTEQSSNVRKDALAAAQAHRDAAKAAVDRTEAESAKYRILAPIGGVVVACYRHPGETVTPAAPIVSIADLGRMRIEAEIDEFDIPAVADQSAVTITAEGYRNRQWRGKVEEIADIVEPRQNRPENPGSPVDTRVLRVRIAFGEPCPLKLGQRVEVEIDRPLAGTAK
jgi:HlyD family secretion protein